MKIKNIRMLLLCAMTPLLLQQVNAAKVTICTVSVDRFPTDRDSDKWYENQVERYIDPFVKSQKITQAAANCYTDKILERYGSRVDSSSVKSTISTLEATFTKLLFQEKKVKGIVGMRDNKNKLPDQEHINSIKELMITLKTHLETEIQTCLDNKRRLALRKKAKLTKAEREELAELEPKASAYQNLSAYDIKEMQVYIERANDFVTRIEGLNSSVNS